MERRRDLIGFTEIEKDKEIAAVVGGSEKFRAFINDEHLKLTQRYRTTNESIIGESASGFICNGNLLLTPQMFDHYIAFWSFHYGGQSI